MALREILLDTNSYSAFKRNVPGAVEVIQHAPSIGINGIVLGELLAGFAGGSRDSENRNELNIFLASNRVRILTLDGASAEYYASIVQDLRQRGRPIPTNDIWIAATALQHGLAVFTYDAHFQNVNGLIIGSRLSDLSA